MTKIVKYTTNDFSLASGKSISPLEIAYETYGKLNKDKTNAVLSVMRLLETNMPALLIQ